jgi:hypothetical protein
LFLGIFGFGYYSESSPFLAWALLAATVLAIPAAYIPYGQKIKTAAKMTVVQASTMEQLSAPFRTAPHGSA